MKPNTEKQVMDTIETALLEQHKGLLHKFARAGYGRLMKVGVEIEYEDVYQEMQISLIKAHRSPGRDRTKGFTAYMGQACRNNFNKFAEKLIREQTSLCLVRERDMTVQMNCNFDRRDEALIDSLFGDETVDSPEELLDRQQQMRAHIAELSLDAKRVVLQLLRPSQDLRQQFDQEVKDALAARERGVAVKISQDHTFAYIGRHLGFTSAKVSKVRRELERIYGIKL